METRRRRFYMKLIRLEISVRPFFSTVLDRAWGVRGRGYACCTYAWKLILAVCARIGKCCWARVEARYSSYIPYIQNPSNSLQYLNWRILCDELSIAIWTKIYVAAYGEFATEAQLQAWYVEETIIRRQGLLQFCLRVACSMLDDSSITPLPRF